MKPRSGHLRQLGCRSITQVAVAHSRRTHRGRMEHGQEAQQQPKASSNRRPLGIALAITITVLVAEVVGGLYERS